VYILLNKPKDFITTAEDEKGRKTVLDIVKNATAERIFPVGRLDRNTTGVLLLTNDGDLAQHLTHPSFEVRKIYEVTLDKPVIKADLEKLLEGVVLEDGPVHADAAGYADTKDKSVVGVEIHSGKNRVVRRMFEHLGYDVRGLDRVMFANLTKKGVDRGKWRFLSEKEVRLLKFFNKSKRKAGSDSVELQDVPYSPRPAAKRTTGSSGKDYFPGKRSEGAPADKREKSTYEKKQGYGSAKKERTPADKREKPHYAKRDNAADGRKSAPAPRPVSERQDAASPLQAPDGKRIRKRIPLK
jgi:pseudouridine synthase